MEEFLYHAKPYLEALQLLSGILVGVAALFALKQISLMKLDMLTRSDRSAKEKAIEAADKYINSNEHYAQTMVDLDEAIASAYKGPVGDFSLESIPPEFREMANRRADSGKFDHALDVMDGIAAMFVSGVADEKMGFTVIGGAYCADVARLYDLIALYKTRYTYGPLTNVIELYNVWSARLTEADLVKATQNLDRQIEMNTSRGTPPLPLLRTNK
jgi:hypothetical protein